MCIIPLGYMQCGLVSTLKGLEGGGRHSPETLEPLYKRHGVVSQKIEIFMNNVWRNLDLAQQAIGHTQNFNPLNANLNPICHLLASLGAHHILHVSRIRVKILIRFFG